MVFMASCNLYKFCALAACTMAKMRASVYIGLMCDIAHPRHVVRTYVPVKFHKRKAFHEVLGCCSLQETLPV